MFLCAINAINIGIENSSPMNMNVARNPDRMAFFCMALNKVVLLIVVFAWLLP